MKSFSAQLLEWYNPNRRNLPWKLTVDAYNIWLSEIILQQTRVEQGLPYYLAFIKKYPTIKRLANAPENDVLKLWEGLGYYSRARNLQFAAKQVMELYNGVFPTTYADIIKLKGIGAYTAAAIASFAYGLPYAVVDGNVFRVLSRIFAIQTPIDTTKGKKRFELLANKLLDTKNPGVYNQAIMDLGALVCKPKLPLCHQCPFSSTCKALELNTIDKYPVKAKKLIKTERALHYFVIYNKKYIYLKQRTENDIWKGLFEFPLEEYVDMKEKNQNYISSSVEININTLPFVYQQTLSHQYIRAHFYEVYCRQLPAAQHRWLKVPKEKILEYAFPKIIRQYLSERLIFLT